MVIQKNKKNKTKEHSSGLFSWLYSLTVVQWFKVCTLLIFGLIFGTLFTHFVLPKSFTPKPTVVNIPRGASPIMIAHILSSKNIIRTPGFFVFYVKLSSVDTKLKSGTYLMSPHFSMTKIIRVLQHLESNRVLEKITIPEGYSLKKIYQLMDNKQLVSGTELKQFVSTSKSIFVNKFEFLKLNPIQSMEGYFYPDTYFFDKGITYRSICYTFLREFENKIIPVWEENKQSVPNNLSFHQVLTLASLIEKEARVKSEMPVISSVFHNRLRKGMRLASDPTVLYALGEPNKKIVLYKDLEVKSPYNTYRNKGLPPGPIASPSVDAFISALKPDKTPYFFFVATPEGSHAFTRTYEEHLAVQRKMKRRKK